MKKNWKSLKDRAIPEAVQTIKEALIQVVNSPEGTGYKACMEETLVAGKTGTAEIKESKEDTKGTELGWFAVFTPEKDAENPFLLITMVEDVKERNGSTYVVEKNKEILQSRLTE